MEEEGVERAKSKEGRERRKSEEKRRRREGGRNKIIGISVPGSD